MNEFSRFNNGNENDDEDSSAQDGRSGSQARQRESVPRRTGGQERGVIGHCRFR
jgi:hypothetical protein